MRKSVDDFRYSGFGGFFDSPGFCPPLGWRTKIMVAPAQALVGLKGKI